MSQILTKNIDNICVLRLSAIGDVLMALPAIMAIQKKHPKAQITWIVSPIEAQILKNIVGLELIIFDKKTAIKSLIGLKKQLKNKRFDLLLHMQPSIRANIISLFVKAKIKLGFNQSKEGQFLFINQKLPKKEKDNISDTRVHFIDGFMQFAQVLGCDNKAINFPKLTTKTDENFAKKIIKTKILVINTCSSASFPYRNWHKDNFIALIKKIPKEITVILIGGKTQLELQTNRYIAEKTGVLDLTGKTTLTQSIAIIKHANMLLSVDSAPVHIADCVKTPVIGLFGATNPKQTGSYFYPQHCISYYPQGLTSHKRFKSYQYIEKISIVEVLGKIMLFF